MHREIYCCACEQTVQAALTDGSEIYPHRPDLRDLPFWICHYCDNYVGCHHKTKDRIRPLGCIPSPEIKKLRMQIHSMLDPLWGKDIALRKRIYRELGSILGREYHTAEIKSVAEANQIIEILKKRK